MSHSSSIILDHPRTAHSGTFISLTVSVSGIVLTDMSSGEVISKHDMQGISFASGGEKVYMFPVIVMLFCHFITCKQSFK